MIEYDVDKDAENQHRRGLPFAAAEFLFDGPFIEEEDPREDYRESRFIATGPIPQFGAASSSWYIRGVAASGVSSASGKPMTEKSENIIRVSREEAKRMAKEWATPENLAMLDAMTDEDIAAQIASNPDAAPELTDEWFENARLVIPLKSRKRAA